MRRTTTTLLALSLTFFSVNAAEAQDDAAMRFGVKAGINFADIELDDTDDPDTQENRRGFVGGIYLTLRPGEFISFQPEVLYSQMGTRFEGQFAGSPVEFEFKLDYIQIPLLARINLGGDNAFIRPHLALGPYVAFNLTCEITGQGGGTTVEDDSCNPQGTAEDAESSFDWGGVFGGGLSFTGSRGTLTIDGRYNLGLADVFDDDVIGNDVDEQHRVWSILAGFSIPFGM